MKNILVIGGDGFCGWPLSLRLSNKGHNVIIVDNLSRRKIDLELGSNSLTKISSIHERINTWKKVTQKNISFFLVDVANEYEKLVQVIKDNNIDVIIHLAEQRAAPYSMKSSKTSRYTVSNNLLATHNILTAIIEINKDIHLVHLGTMGVYGYGTIKDSIIQEGYMTVKMNDGKGNFKDVEILHPTYPGSIYHLTKSQDELFFQFYVKNYGLKITDLHQGIIWGMNTKETLLDPKLVNRFDYDSDYGTVLNRFIMQAACNIPLTIYGTGEQTRAFIHIENSMDCIELAINNPPSDKVLIFNQMTECHKLLNLANIIKELFDNIKFNFVKNPRKELAGNNLFVKNDKFINLGLKPKLLNSDELVKIYNYIYENKNDINMEHIMPKSFW